MRLKISHFKKISKQNLKFQASITSSAGILQLSVGKVQLSAAPNFLAHDTAVHGET